MPDIEIGGGNGFYTVTPRSPEGEEWINENVSYEPWQCLGNSIGVDDGRMAYAIATGAQAAGLEVV